LNGKSTLGGKLPAYDGRKSLYTAGALPFDSEEFVVTLVDPEKKEKERSSQLLGHFTGLYETYLQLFNPFDFVGWRENTRSQFELLEEQTCTTFTSFCVEDRGTCLKRPYKYLMLSSGSLRLGSIIAVLEFFS